MTPDSPHRWALTRFAARRAGLLDDDEERRLDEHLRSCATCREAWGADRGGPAPGQPDAHIPAGVLATWPRATLSLQGLERAMIREHLEHCAECRQELELLGYAPSLEVEPALEWTVERTERPVVQPVPAARNTIRIIQLAPQRRDWMRWAFGGWAAIASAAALLLVMNPGLVGRGEDSFGGRASPPSEVPTPAARGSLVLGEPSLYLGLTRRGDHPKIPGRVLSAESRLVALRFEPLDLPPKAPVVVTIRREQSGDSLVITVPNEELLSGRVVLTREGGSLEPGTYRADLRGSPTPGSSTSKSATHRFILSSPPPDSPP